MTQTSDGSNPGTASDDGAGAGRKRRRSESQRARKRAIRASAASAGVSYLVAARHLGRRLEASASAGRTVYPDSSDEHRAWLIALREQRPYQVRVEDTRRAILFPLGRAAHLVERFPPLRGEPGLGVDRCYDGEARPAVLAMLYATVVAERASVLPSVDELAWLAELGEETAVDLACTCVDRAARELLDDDRWTMWTRIDAALMADEHHDDRQRREAARQLADELRCLAIRSSVDGARQTLDAVLISGDGGHAPGTRVRIIVRPYRGRTATIVGAHWGPNGPPIGYDVIPDSAAVTVCLQPGDMTLVEQARTRVPV
jgi:hypothetical protein